LRCSVKLPDGTIVSALGQGSAALAQGRHREAEEEEALRTGLSLGMTLIDTAEIYGNGRSEELISRVIAGRRDQVFLVSKVWPDHVRGDGIARACEASLSRLGTTISTSTCCIGQVVIAPFPALWPGSKAYAALERFAPGACPTSRSATWKSFSRFQTVIAVR